MNIIRIVGHHMQTPLGPSLDQIGRQTGVIQRQRKFAGMTRLKTLVITLLKSPLAGPDKSAIMAARLGLIVPPEAMETSTRVRSND